MVRSSIIRIHDSTCKWCGDCLMVPQSLFESDGATFKMYIILAKKIAKVFKQHGHVIVKYIDCHILFQIINF